MRNKWRVLVLLGSVAFLGTVPPSCEYGRMLANPQALKQLDPDLVRLVNELPNVDHPNKEIVARLFAQSGLAKAQRGADGVYRSTITVPNGELIWKPAIIVMPTAGDLQLDFVNEDKFSHHAALLPSNGSMVLVLLPTYERGRALLHLSAPGLYWFGCPVADHAGRGMLGLIMVGGTVPSDARLDRPAQAQP